jgi:hypothetical protein
MTGSMPSLRRFRGDLSDRRRLIRYAAAAASIVTALLYFGIGIGLLIVVDVTRSSSLKC